MQMALLIFLSILFLVAIYIIFNLYTKVQKLEEQIITDAVPEERAYLIYDNLLKLLIRCNVELSSIDKRGTYSSDDEVGFAFKIIKGSIENLVSEINMLNNTDGDEEKK